MSASTLGWVVNEGKREAHASARSSAARRPWRSLDGQAFRACFVVVRALVAVAAWLFWERVED